MYIAVTINRATCSAFFSDSDSFQPTGKSANGQQANRLNRLNRLTGKPKELFDTMSILYKIFIHTILIFFMAFAPCMAGNPLTDEEKKTIVYEMYGNYKKYDFPDVKDIHPKQAMELLKAGKVVFVDIRKQAEMDVSMLPDSIPEAAFLEHPEKYKNKIVIAYCTISYRSALFTQKMQKQNIPIQNLIGGLLAWVLEGGKIYDQKGETRRIHVYGKEWNYPADGYDSVMFGFFERLFDP
jgi:rhodanese-related sulfurtransferase